MIRTTFALLFTLHLLYADSVLNTATTLIQKHEGFVSKPYADSKGISIGYGTNLSVGISQEEALYLLQFRLIRIQDRLKHLSWFRKLNPVRQVAIIDLTYNIGFAGLLTFKDFLWCLKHNYFNAASNRLLDSLYAKQTGNRAKYIAYLIKHG